MSLPESRTIHRAFREGSPSSTPQSQPNHFYKKRHATQVISVSLSLVSGLVLSGLPAMASPAPIQSFKNASPSQLGFAAATSSSSRVDLALLSEDPWLPTATDATMQLRGAISTHASAGTPAEGPKTYAEPLAFLFSPELPLTNPGQNPDKVFNQNDESGENLPPTRTLNPKHKPAAASKAVKHPATAASSAKKPLKATLRQRIKSVAFAKYSGHAHSGFASWYGPGFHGRRCANGSRFNMNGLTAAHRTLPFGTQLRVVNPNTGKSCIVVITDRGPYCGKRVIDLSRGAAAAIGMLGSGVAKISYEVVASAAN